MTKRAWLICVIKGMFFLLIAGFVYILLSGTLSVKQVRPTSDENKEQSVGSVKMQRVNAKRVWISHFSEQQIEFRSALNKLVIKEKSGCDVLKVMCVIEASTGRAGIEFIYLKELPSNLPSDTLWHGGYIDPNNGAAYDLFGRGYKFNPKQAAIELGVLSE